MSSSEQWGVIEWFETGTVVAAVWGTIWKTAGMGTGDRERDDTDWGVAAGVELGRPEAFLEAGSHRPW